MNTNEYWSALFKALAEPLRLRMLHLLHDVPELCVCDFVTLLGVPQSMVSRHLSYLRNAGWVTSRRDGVWIHYRLVTGSQSDPLQQEILEALCRHGSRDPILQQDLIQLHAMERSPDRC